MPELQYDFDEKFNKIKNNYLLNLKEKYNSLIILKNLILKTENLNVKHLIDALQEAYGYIHKLSGSSAMFGFQELSKTSNNLELLLKNFIKNSYSGDKKTICQNLEALLNEIEKAINYNKVTI